MEDYTKYLGDPIEVDAEDETPEPEVSTGIDYTQYLGDPIEATEDQTDQAFDLGSDTPRGS